jgi:hypothetical protein
MDKIVNCLAKIRNPFEGLQKRENEGGWEGGKRSGGFFFTTILKKAYLHFRSVKTKI